jgi:hypothetical protein
MSQSKRPKNERVELEMKIMEYRRLAAAQALDEATRRRMEDFIAELERKYQRDRRVGKRRDPNHVLLRFAGRG